MSHRQIFYNCRNYLTDIKSSSALLSNVFLPWPRGDMALWECSYSSSDRFLRFLLIYCSFLLSCCNNMISPNGGSIKNILLFFFFYCCQFPWVKPHIDWPVLIVWLTAINNPQWFFLKRVVLLSSPDKTRSPLWVTTQTSTDNIFSYPMKFLSIWICWNKIWYGYGWLPGGWTYSTDVGVCLTFPLTPPWAYHVAFSELLDGLPWNLCPLRLNGYNLSDPLTFHFVPHKAASICSSSLVGISQKAGISLLIMNMLSFSDWQMVTAKTDFYLFIFS